MDEVKGFSSHTLGTIGQCCAVETLHKSMCMESGTGKSFKTGPVMAVRIACTSSSVSCVCAISP